MVTTILSPLPVLMRNHSYQLLIRRREKKSHDLLNLVNKQRIYFVLKSMVAHGTLLICSMDVLSEIFIVAVQKKFRKYF